MRLLNEEDVFNVIEKVTNEAIEKGLKKATIQKSLIYELGLLKPIEATPTSHGHFIRTASKKYRCSKCGEIVSYCHGCGTKLDGPFVEVIHFDGKIKG